MELIAVIFMLVAGGGIAILVVIVLAMNTSDRGGGATQIHVPERDRVAASLLFRVMTAGGTPADEARREIRRRSGIIAPPTARIDIANWGERYAQNSTPQQRARLLDLAVQLVAVHGRPIPLVQYVALLDLSFSLGFQTDALAKLREQYGFDYVDHAKASRPRDADRAGGATTFFVREQRDMAECRRVLGVEEGATRQEIIAAYRRLASQHHPDRFHDSGGTEREDAAGRFIEITRAYEALLALYRE